MRVASQFVTDRQQQAMTSSIAAIIQHYFAVSLIAAGWDSAQENRAPVSAFHLKPLPTMESSLLPFRECTLPSIMSQAIFSD
jgi:hypothetical protein